MTWTPVFDGGTASRVALGAALQKQRAQERMNVAAFMGYGIPPAQKPEPRLTFKPETPAEERIHAAAAKRGWGNRPAPAGEVHFIRPGATDVVVTRDALKRLPTLGDTIIRQLENG